MKVLSTQRCLKHVLTPEPLGSEARSTKRGGVQRVIVQPSHPVYLNFGF